MEGWGYTAATNDNAVAGTRNAYIPIPDRERLEINDAAFREPSPETVGRLVETYDVSWLFVAKAYPADIPGLNEWTISWTTPSRTPSTLLSEGLTTSRS